MFICAFGVNEDFLFSYLINAQSSLATQALVKIRQKLITCSLNSACHLMPEKNLVYPFLSKNSHHVSEAI